MKKSIGILLGIFVAASTVFAANTKGEKKAFEIDTKESKVYWTGKKVTGEHTGHVSIGNGEVMLENGKVTGANVNMDLNTIVCTDLTDEQWNQKLVGHLKSDDFFSVEKYPVANFEITKIKPQSNGEHTVNGNLTIKGQTHEISFPAKVSNSNGMITANGTAILDRTKWDIQYGSGKFFKGLGDNLIYDEFEITFDIKAKSDTQEISAD